MSKKLGFWAPTLVLAAALVLLAVGTGSVDAARGGKGHGKPGSGTTPTTVTMTVSPDPVPAGTSATVTGTGFTPGATVNFVVDGGWVIGTGADANGVAKISFTVGSPGTVGVTAKQRASDGSFVVVGFFTFSVV